MDCEFHSGGRSATRITHGSRRVPRRQRVGGQEVQFTESEAVVDSRAGWRMPLSRVCVAARFDKLKIIRETMGFRCGGLLRASVAWHTLRRRFITLHLSSVYTEEFVCAVIFRVGWLPLVGAQHSVTREMTTTTMSESECEWNEFRWRISSTNRVVCFLSVSLTRTKPERCCCQRRVLLTRQHMVRARLPFREINNLNVAI